VECRSDDPLAEGVRAVDDQRTRAAVTAERVVLAELEAGCSAPVGALAEVADGDDGEELWLRAVVLSADGAVAIRRSGTGSPTDPARVGSALAAVMLGEGAAALLGERVP
jgi:hydroxymethylbilane synthase